jgi:hypothetical protein
MMAYYNILLQFVMLTDIQLGREFSILLIVLCINRSSVGELQYSLISFGSKFYNIHLNRLEFCHLSKKKYTLACQSLSRYTQKKLDILIVVQEAIHMSEW